MTLDESDATSPDEPTSTEARIFLDSIVEHVPNMVFVKEASELRFVLFNRAGERLLGVSRQGLLGKNDHDLFPKEQADFFRARDRETLESGEMVDIPSEPIQTAQGERWLHTQKVPILGQDGQPRYLLGISEDITERMRAQEQLVQAHAELERRVAERTAELSRANYELRREITERQRAQEALKKSEAQLLQAQKMEAIGRLAGGIAHDFNNILTAILNYAELIGTDLPSDSPVQEDLQQIVKASNRAAALTRELLTFSRRQHTKPEELQLADLVHGMEAMLRPLVGDAITLRTFCPADLGRVMLERSQMEQVMLNLVVNAREAMPRGGKLTIEVSDMVVGSGTMARSLNLEPGTYGVVSVSDTGVGMSAEVARQIFEPFFTTKPRATGAGLGLSTVFGIVKQAKGEVSVYSQPGRGSTFKIFLPHCEPAAQPEPPSELTAVAIDKPTVLIVEDEDLVRAAACRILSGAGYKVLEAKGGELALTIARAHRGPIHVLLSDVVMPGLDGRGLAERLRADRPELRVLFMSGYPGHALGDGTITADLELIAKPFTPNALIQRIEELLARGRSAVRPGA